MTMKKTSLLILGLFSMGIVSAQVGVNTESPKSTLDVTAINATTHIAGIQAPRLTLAELTAKGNSLYGTAQVGTIIFISDISGGNKTGQRVNITIAGYYYFDGSAWQKLGAFEITDDVAGDVKYSFMTVDHQGWYLLNGRAISTLPAAIQAKATSLGFTTNLPNTSDRTLKTKTTSEALGTLGGTTTKTITQANLPSAPLAGTLTANLASAGAHTHTTGTVTLNTADAHAHTVSTNLVAAGAHTHTVAGTLAAAGAHTHAVSGTLASAGAHTHTATSIYYINSDVDRGPNAGAIWSMLASTNTTTSSAGAHTHTVSGTTGSAGGHTHAVTGSLATADAHTHTVSGTLPTANAHTHSVSGSFASTGAHQHQISGTASFPTGGSGTALNNRSAYMVVNTFIYLGQ
ncbi:Phage tail fibre repeat-containing protein [Dysgonomonas macrotermitis]|uniref:Phage tail fibre repeat-containing protein n=2 Tax=Dysgonomonas macrotermitis TaxID=1346286 RepID=A0A1M4YUR9_9BACT|nr:Phage tail fibre repeat-containing protein [Dysgonomonas macrotermitis]